MKRNQWAAGFLAILLFFCGAVVGALGHRYYTVSSVSANGSSEAFRHHYVSEMESRLNLTPAQLIQLESILDDTKTKYKSVRDSYHPAMLKIKAEQISRVKSILTPEQVPLYIQLVAERERRAKDQEERDRQQDQSNAMRRARSVSH